MVLATIMQCVVLCGTTTPPNAADAWREYFIDFDLYEFPTIKHEDGFEMLYFENETWNDEAHAIREQLAPFIERARSIASTEHCDWQLDYSQGLDLLVPHYGQLRSVQKMLHYSMRGEMDLGNSSAALTEMNAMFGITKHSAESDLLIGSLVAHSSFMFATINTAIIDSATEAQYVETILASVDRFKEFDPFGVRENISNEKDITLNWLNNTENQDFAFFQSITDQPIDTSTIDIDAEIKQYSYAIGEMEKIFQIKDKNEALAAAKELDKELQNGEMGFLATALCPTATNLLKHAFEGEELVSDFKQLLQTKIDMLRNPNAATFFLQAVDAYNGLDSEERTRAIARGDYSVIETPLNLFVTACSMPVAQITLAETPETPSWVAPLYALAIDCLSRGTTEDHEMVAEFVGHMSMQKRFAASIVAGKLFGMLQWSAFPEAMKKIPSADAFGLHGSARSDRERLKAFCNIDGDWNPSNANVLAMTLTIAKENGISDINPEAWKTFVEAIGLPDEDAVLVAILEEWMPDSIPLIELEQEPAFDEMLKNIKTNFARVVKSIRSRGR
jgi:hypothetical protein